MTQLVDQNRSISHWIILIESAQNLACKGQHRLVMDSFVCGVCVHARARREWWRGRGNDDTDNDEVEEGLEGY